MPFVEPVNICYVILYGDYLLQHIALHVDFCTVIHLNN